MERSAFQFSNPTLNKLDFRVNEYFDPVDIASIEMENQLSINVEKSEDEQQALVTLTVSINENLEVSPFTISAEISAAFRWEDSIDSNMLDTLLSKNAPALLLAYIRPIIANVTNSSKYPAYNIPFLNFSS